jgi:hypothetical protein
MLKSIRILLAAALLSAGSAQAFVANVGANPAAVSFANGFAAGGSFQDIVAFDLTGPYVVSTFVFSQWTTPTAGLRDLTLDLFRGTTLLGSVGPSTVVPGGGAVPSFTALSFSDLLGPGSYRAVLGGQIRPDGGSYVWGLTATMVPEPATWATLVGGLALLAVIARRRRAR